MNLKDLKILVVGVGGLGCPASLALAEAGVGTLGLMDPDVVEISNLHRQILYSKADLGQPKVIAASKFLGRNYPQVKIMTMVESMNVETMDRYLPEYDLVIDGLDRLEKKFFLNDRCVQAKKPFVHAGVVKFEGQVLGVLPGITACLRCLLPKVPPPFAMPTCREAGVLGAFSQAVGYLQAHEALALAGGNHSPRLWKMDIVGKKTRALLPDRNRDCSACGQGRVDSEPVESACSA